MPIPTPDAAAVALFNRQHAYASVEQLYEVGLSKEQIAYRVRKGIYRRVAYGVVSLGPPRSTVLADAMRGVLVAGAGAVASLWTAAALHELDAPREAQVHVVVPSTRRLRTRPELCVHRTRSLPSDDVVVVAGVPVTAIPRTIVDCAERLDAWSALHVLDSSSASPGMWRKIHATAARMSNGRAGVRAIATATAPGGADRLRSTFERRARDALQAHGVPQGKWNTTISDARGVIREVDLCYPEARLAIEIDGLRFHSHRDAARRDRQTDRRLALAGWTVLRFTWQDVVYRPAILATEICAALDLR